MADVVHIGEGEHSPLGPSAAKRWLNCPASVAATADVPDEQTIFAASGTASHSLAEWCRLQNVRCEQFLGTTLKVGKFEFIVDKARCDSVNAFCDYVADLGGESWCEQRVSYEQYVKGGFGTGDDARVVGDTLHIPDFKDGEGVVVDAEDNEQLMLYALGWLLKWHWLYPQVVVVVLHIVQPRVNHFVRSREYNVEEVFTWAEEVARPGALATKNPNAPYNPGSWCSDNFCRIRRSCRARAESMAEAVTEGFTSLDAAVGAPVSKPATLANDEIAKLLHKLPQMVKWIGELKAHAALEVSQGRAVGDWKFVDGRSSRSLAVAEDVAVDLIVREAEIDKSELYTEPALKSVAQIEAVIGPQYFKEATQKKAAGPLAHLVKKTRGKPTLVPGSDKRPALAAEAAKEFQDLDVVDDLFE